MRPAPRLHVAERLGQGAFALGQGHARYLGSVLRLGPGDEVRLFNERDGEWVYTISALKKREGEAEPLRQRRAPAEEGGPVLLFAPLKRGPTEFIIQKGTELGVAVFRPVITERTNRDHLKLDRLELIATEAAEQCERLTLPAIEAPVPLAEALAATGDFVFCDEAGEDESEPWGGAEGRAGLADHVFAGTDRRPGAILIGPEGGFTPEERADLRERDGSLPISLGPRILRAETAAITALTLWQVAFGDLRDPRQRD